MQDENALVVQSIVTSSLKNATLLLQWAKNCLVVLYRENELVVRKSVTSSLNNAKVLFMEPYSQTVNGSGELI